MWEGRARAARRDVTALATAGLGVADLHTAAIELVERAVPAELTCWASLDPDTTVISLMTSGANRIPPEYEPLLANSEYTDEQPHTFAAMARRPDPVARLADLPHGERGARYDEVWRPLGLHHELRTVFRVDGTCWGAAGMVRDSPFTDREAEFMAAVAPALAAATRVAARCGAARGEPAIVVAREDGSVRAVTAAVEPWRSELDSLAPGRFAVMVQVAVLGARRTGSFRARVRDASGGWLVFHASQLVGSGETAETVVTIGRASGAEMLGLLLAAYGLTQRERDVCREVVAGRSNAEIAGRLGISARTVQDHLKSVFAKVDVHSRGGLVARLRPDG